MDPNRAAQASFTSPQPAADDAALSGITQADGLPRIGPFDLADRPPDGRERADFGALLIPRVEGTWLRLSLAGPLPALIVTDGASTVELSVLAAPRREGLWAAVRADLLAALDEEDGAVVEMGTRGPELHLPVMTEQGPTRARVAGIDGPRWFLCAVFTGEAATDPSAAPALDELLDATVVVRGSAPMPVREPIPLIPPDRRAAPVVEVPSPRETAEIITLGKRGMFA
ncbi:DUF3710 domain-containing protein [Frankia sp. R82]|uniref:DUF3710 domain-containing protein n=1 Tax=Frankia sp. R82 TaxID=2950553 RepID=UPI0020443616|nr:DUF3710 domain-containing protein [Frankia sp. R82]MCM3885726.1 DUF3710 domain-containing protein [Frankia sp. R82]